MSKRISSQRGNQNDIHRHGYHDQPRHPLILCASLVQHPSNLGGLCRLAEIFRLQALVLSDLAIAHSQAFRGLSASAYRWQPLWECPKDKLVSWIADQKRNGYRAIALDISPSAHPIETFQFPQRAVLVLGRELTGIPDSLLNQCDCVVTITQYGVVESLNVQNAGAIAIYEYIRQHGSPISPSPKEIKP